MASGPIPLYGYIHNPLTNSEVLYILKETVITPTTFSYDGLIGYGKITNDTQPDDNGFPVQFTPADMEDIRLIYDKCEASVTLCSFYRWCYSPTDAPLLKNNVETDSTRKFLNLITDFPIICFPRSRHSVAVSTAINKMFPDRDITIFAPKEWEDNTLWLPQ